MKLDVLMEFNHILPGFLDADGHDVIQSAGWVEGLQVPVVVDGVEIQTAICRISVPDSVGAAIKASGQFIRVFDVPEEGGNA